MIEVNYIFSVGFRCYSPNVLKTHNLRTISGPFDYLFIDIETVFEIINNGFVNFLKDIVLINKNSNRCEIFYSINSINEKLLEFKKNENIGYMKHNYNNKNLLFNQNFIENNSNNLYDWRRICLFLEDHHNLINSKTYDNIHKRITIFKNAYDKNKNKCCLFHITKIIESKDFKSYRQYISNLRHKYNIKGYMIVIICSDKLDETYTFEDDVLYIVKKVKNYEYQFDQFGTDNNLNYQKEIDIMNRFFNFNLIEYGQIISQFKNDNVITMH